MEFSTVKSSVMIHPHVKVLIMEFDKVTQILDLVVTNVTPISLSIHINITEAREVVHIASEGHRQRPFLDTGASKWWRRCFHRLKGG